MVRMLFLVDGYNITKGDPATCALSLEAQRDTLVARLRTRGAQLLGSGHIVVFFDGETGMPQGPTERSASYPVEVVYARGVSADDAIVERAARQAGAAVCIVSSDVELVERARAHAGASLQVRARESAYDSAKRTARRGAGRGPARDAGLPPGANEITKELKGLWLEDEE